MLAWGGIVKKVGALIQVKFFGLKDDIAKEIIKQSLQDVTQLGFKDVSVSFNHDPKFPFPNCDFNVLILWEPSAVMPWQYSKANYNKFDLVIPMSKWRASALGINDYAFHPFDYDHLTARSEDNFRTRKIVMINSAKFSAGRSSLYGLRRAISRKLYKSEIDYDLYGSNWQMTRVMEIRKRLVALKNSVIARERIGIKELLSDFWYKYPEYKGWVDDKFELLSHYELSLVIENEADWVTEKVFDALYAGSVPIYVGPNLADYFPQLSKCVVQVSARPEEIIEAIRGISQEEILEKRLAARDFLSDLSMDGIGFWHPKNQWQKVSEIITSKVLLARDFNT
jgi:hypothetical protein